MKKNHAKLVMVILLEVDSEVCEQTFSWLSQLICKITRHMNQNRFIFYIVNLCELRNRRVERTHNTSS